jgi:TrmH family RNA methyltransferase
LAAEFSGVPLFVVLERIEKPGNIGAIFRSADCAGINGIILADQLTDLYNPNTIRASLGTLFSIPVVETTGTDAKEQLIKNDIKIAVAKCNGEFSYTKYDFCQPTAIVLGSESDGLSELWTGQNVTSISIPMNGIADSLNVSTAAAILFYEAKRQIKEKYQKKF